MKKFLAAVHFLAGVLFVVAPLAASAGTLGTYTSGEKGFDTHTFWYDDGKEVTLIDTQFVPELTEAMVSEVRRKTASPITRIVVTHANPDKYNGLPYLHRMNVESITSKAVAEEMPAVHAYKKDFWVHVAKAFQPGEYPAFENVRTTFDRRMTIRLKSGETLSLFELANPGVTNKQVVVRVDRTGDLIVGDLVHYKAHLWLEGGLRNGKPNADLKKWSSAVSELTALASDKPRARLYGGRGGFAEVRSVVDEQKRYLGEAENLVKNYIADLGVRKDELRDPVTAAPHYKILEQRFATSFPDYQLPYMIGYSVYGLVASLLN